MSSLTVAFILDLLKMSDNKINLISLFVLYACNNGGYLEKEMLLEFIRTSFTGKKLQ